MTTFRSAAAMILTVALWPAAPTQAGEVTHWNAITLQCVQGGGPLPAQRGGPAGLLDIALVHAAMHDAVQAIEGRFEPYAYENPELRGAGSPEAAAAAAAHGVLAGLYGADAPCLENVPDPLVVHAGDGGLVAGVEAAAAVLPLHRPTMVLPTDPFTGGTDPGDWRPTTAGTVGAATFLAHTAPFAMTAPSQFRPPAPPSLLSGRYRRDYEEVMLLGSLDSSARTSEQTELARFWTANFFTQWNAALRNIADAYLPDTGDQARLLALTSFVAADSQISVYDAKYRYNFWRPVTAIREGDNDGNPLTQGDPAWTSFVAAPAYPEYSSGANCLTGALMTMLELYFGTDEVEFAVHSTASGLTVNPRTYQRFSQAADEVLEARIVQGIHFRFADEIGRRQGTRLARWTFNHYLQPSRPR